MQTMEVLLIMVVCFLVAAGLMLLGGWLVFRSRATQGERLFRQPRGEAFTIPDLDQAQAFPGAGEPTAEEKTMLEKTERFLNIMGGKKS